jgi:hypothetical protein
MQLHGNVPKDDPPTSEELDNFDTLLTSERFDESSYDRRKWISCAGWLQRYEDEVAMWIRTFRLERPDLLKTLLEIQTSLKGLFKSLDRLCAGRRCYLARSSFGMTSTIQALYDKEFLAVYDELFDILEMYLPYAKAYKKKTDNDELLDISPMRVEPKELRGQFIQKLELIQHVLGNLAASVDELVARKPDLAGPGAKEAAAPS